jgi:hypothetical protein
MWDRPNGELHDPCDGSALYGEFEAQTSKQLKTENCSMKFKNKELTVSS